MGAALHIPIAASSSSFLITPNVGLMIWVLVVFAIALVVLRMMVFPAIGKVLDDRAARISADIDSAEQLRTEADKVLEEYRERLQEARKQAEEIIDRAHKAGDAHHQQVIDEAKADRERQLEQTRMEIEQETQRAIGQIRREVADLTVLATEKVTRKSLGEADQRRLIDEALGELDFSALTGGSK